MWRVGQGLAALLMANKQLKALHQPVAEALGEAIAQWVRQEALLACSDVGELAARAAA